MIKTCQECDGRLVGRSDKKFCSSACRNAYNNKQNQDTTNLMRNVNNRLRKNHRILAENNSEGKTKISRQKLLNFGFDFTYFTQIVTYKNSTQYFFVYEQGYKFVDTEHILLVKKNEE